jgi:putative lipoic acid-binding regulatory protein
MANLKPPSLIEFPCTFPIKVMGLCTPSFAQTVCDLLCTLNPGFDASSVQLKPSRQGKYLSLHCPVYVHNQDELDDIYRALSSHPMVAVVL